MNCHGFRDSVNELIDGDIERLPTQAAEHELACADCRQWRRGMSSAMSMLDKTELEMPGESIAAAVMARLPERHPASIRRASVGFSRRALAWLAGCWLVGLLIIVGSAAVLWLIYGAAGFRPDWQGLVGRTVSVGIGAMVVVRPLAATFRDVLVGIGAALGKHYMVFVLFTVLDTAALIAGYAAWRSRRTAAGIFCA